MIRATFTPGVAAADGVPGSRTVAGVAVPWDTPGTVSDGTTVVFHPGAIDDAARPLGRVIAATATSSAMLATARIARTRDGDEALILAAPPDQVLGMFSVGVDPTDWNYDQDGTMHVYAADWHELSLLTMGAFSDARVATVTAAQPEEPMDQTRTLAELDPDPDEVDPDAPVDDDDDEETTTRAELVPVRATAGGRRAPAVPLRAGTGKRSNGPTLDLRGLATLIGAGVEKGVSAARTASRIQAALTNVLTTDVPGAVPPYRADLVPIINQGMPLVDAIASRPLPPYGMKVEYPIWTAAPSAYAIQATEKTQIASGPVTMGEGFADIKTWAQGNDISFQTAQRSNPSFIEMYLQGCAADAAKKYDTYVGTELLAAANAATMPAVPTFTANVQALFAALDPATTPAGALFLACSHDVYVHLIGVTGDVGPAYWDLSLNISSMSPETSSGLDTFIDPYLPAGTMLLGSKTGAVSYGGPSTSADVRVVDVGLLGYDIGVYFYAALAIPYPDAFAKLTGIVPPVTGGAASTSSKAK